MAVVFIPARWRHLAGGHAQVHVAGSTVRQVVEALADRFPGIKARLYDAGADTLAPGLAVCVDGVAGELGLLEPVGPHSEVHFLPAIAGG